MQVISCISFVNFPFEIIFNQKRGQASLPVLSNYPNTAYVLAEISLQQTLESLAVSRFVAGHLMYSVVEAVGGKGEGQVRPLPHQAVQQAEFPGHKVLEDVVILEDRGSGVLQAGP